MEETLRDFWKTMKPIVTLGTPLITAYIGYYFGKLKDVDTNNVKRNEISLETLFTIKERMFFFQGRSSEDKKTYLKTELRKLEQKVLEIELIEITKKIDTIPDTNTNQWDNLFKEIQIKVNDLYNASLKNASIEYELWKIKTYSHPLVYLSTVPIVKIKKALTTSTSILGMLSLTMLLESLLKLGFFTSEVRSFTYALSFLSLVYWIASLIVYYVFVKSIFNKKI